MEATVIIAGTLTAKLVVAKDGSWAIVGDQGRTTGAKAMSVGMAKRAALEALRDLLQTGVSDLERALRSA